MILEGLADARKVVDDIHVEFFEQSSRAKAGDLQELCGVDRATAADDFLRMDALGPLACIELNAHGASPFKEDSCGERAKAHLEVGASFDRMIVGASGTPTLAVLDGSIEASEAFLGLAVDVSC